MLITHHPEEKHFLAMEGSIEMGFLSYEWESETCFAITHTVVDEAYRGQGVARALVDAAIAFAKKNGYTIHPVCSYAKAVIERK